MYKTKHVCKEFHTRILNKMISLDIQLCDCIYILITEYNATFTNEKISGFHRHELYASLGGSHSILTMQDTTEIFSHQWSRNINGLDLLEQVKIET